VSSCERLLRDRVLPALELGFVRPPSVDELHWAISTLQGLYSYAVARSEGAPPEDARYLLPQSVKTRVLVTMNARELLEVFLPLRLCRRAQWEIREVAMGIWAQLYRLEPRLWRYAGPRCVRVAQLTGGPVAVEDIARGAGLGIGSCPEGLRGEKAEACARSVVEEMLKLLG